MYLDENVVVWTVLVVILSFTPLAGFTLSLFLLLIINNKKSLKFFCLYASIALSLIASSRYIGGTYDDVVDYYFVYDLLARGGSIFEATGYLGSDIELLFTSFLYLISLVLPNLNEVQFLGLVSFILSMGILSTVYYINREKKAHEIGLILVLTASLLSLSVLNQIIRQGFSSIFIILAIYDSGIKRWMLVLLATLFHFSALVIFVILFGIRMLAFKLINLYLFISGFFLLAGLAPFVYDYVVRLDLSNVPKLGYYADYNLMEGFTNVDLGNLKLFTIVIVMVIASFISNPKIIQSNDSKFCFFSLLIFYIIYVVLLPLPLASSRFTALCSIIFLGHFVGSIITHLQFSIGRVMGILVIIIKSIMLWSFLIFESYESDYWFHYPAFSYIPGYFLPVFIGN